MGTLGLPLRLGILLRPLPHKEDREISEGLSVGTCGKPKARIQVWNISTAPPPDCASRRS